MRTVISRDCVVYQGKLYFVAEGNLFPAELDYDENTIRCLPVSGAEIAQIDLSLSVGAKAYFLEASGKRILEYDLETFALNEFPIYCDQNADGNYAFVTVVENQIYIFTKKMKKLVIFDLITKQVREKSYPAKEGGVSFACGCNHGDYIWLFPESGDQIFSYHIPSNEWNRYKFPVSYENSLHAVWGNECIYLLTWAGEIYEFDPNCLQNRMLIVVAGTDKGELSRILYAEEKLLLLPGKGNDFFSFDLRQNKLCKLDVWPKDIQFEKAREKWFKFFGYCEDKQYYYLANRTSNYYLRIDKISLEFLWNKVLLPTGKDIIQNMLFYTSEVLIENDYCLADYISCVTGRECVSNQDARQKIVGNDIWNAVK